MIRKFTDRGRRKTKDELKASYYQDYVVYCKCGHSITFNPKHTKELCTHCGHYVYRDEKEKFKEMLKRELRRL